MAVMNPLGSRNIIIIDDNYIGEYSQAYMEVGKQIDDIIHKNIILIFYFLAGSGRINSAFRIIKYLDHILDLAEGTYSGSIG